MIQKKTETELLDKIKESYQFILRDKLVGIYVHGSIAFKCFTWENSDIDFLVVVKEALTQAEKEVLISELLLLDEYAPQKGFEMSVVLQSVCKPFVYPTPYELHYSNSYRERYREDLTGLCQSLNGVDKDLAAHITVINAVGFPLRGPAVGQVFGPVPKADYLDSLLCDVEGAREEICENPVYFVLNLCRVAAYLKENLVLSKKQGGEWGLEHLSKEYQDLIHTALEVYSGKGMLTGTVVWNEGALRKFASEMIAAIRLMV